MEQHLLAYKHAALKHQLYLNNYARYFRDIAEQDVKLLELGIYEGGSLLLWRDFFRSGKIVGLDLNRIEIDDPTGRISIYQGDQCDLGLLDRIATECAPDRFDIIIDDASHIAEFTKISFWHLFDNHLKPGGLYVIEDWRVGYSVLSPDGGQYKWPKPTRARLGRFSHTPERKSQFPSYNRRTVGLVKQALVGLGMNTIVNRARRLYLKLKYKSRFPSHDYGMVGLVKQLMDELGMDQITNPARGGMPPQRYPKFQRMEVCPGTVFVVKATEQDHLRRFRLFGQLPGKNKLKAGSGLLVSPFPESNSYRVVGGML